MQKKGVVAAGHEQTAKAAGFILSEGGNAFDAVIAAHLAACVVEPVLSSLAGGGFLMAQTAAGNSVLYDFFVQTPIAKRAIDDTDFFPISADFGTVQQEFHIGLGSIATPGTVKGLFAVHRELGTLPMTVLAEPAIALARSGVAMNAFQAYIFDVVQAIYLNYSEARKTFGSKTQQEQLLQQGEILYLPDFADCLEALAREGEAFFYQGEIAAAVTQLCAEQGGHLVSEDFNQYRVIKRKPLPIDYRDATVLTNPAPSSGGTLIAFALQLLQSFDLSRYAYGSASYLDLLAQVQAMTNKARIDAYLDDSTHHPGKHILDPDVVEAYRTQIKPAAMCSRGTTQISVIDCRGNIASLTTSNGEGCGLFVPGTGIMLNNMLGEEDLNPKGFHHWPTDQRMTSMMAPCIVTLPDKRRIALGSGGSNRLRTAILQVLLNLIDFKMPLDQAVTQPRIHHEAGLLSIEGGFNDNEIAQLLKKHPNYKVWYSRNLFFGGTHTVSSGADGFFGIGDPRRGGYALEIA
ncbi:MAG: gamma-glutamyltransferase [Gammaproteobacteria bacterium]